MTNTQYTLVRAPRKTVSLRVRRDLSVEVRAPVHMPEQDIDAVVERHAAWIEAHRRMIRERAAFEAQNALCAADIARLKALALEALPARVAYFSKKMGVLPGGIKITSAQGRWGSCSAKNSLCFSYRLMLLPDELIDSVVVHELAHIVEKNHGPHFYSLVLRHMPDYHVRDAQIRQMQGALPVG